MSNHDECGPGTIEGRCGKGHWNTGVSGNAGGRTPNKATTLAREYTVEAVAVVVAVMRDEGAEPAERLKAAFGIIDRGWGKPKEHVEHTGADGGPIPIVGMSLEQAIALERETHKLLEAELAYLPELTQ